MLQAAIDALRYNYMVQIVATSDDRKRAKKTRAAVSVSHST